MVLLRVLVGVLVGVLVAPYAEREVRAPRLLEPTPESELPAVCKACRQLLRPQQGWFHFGGPVLRGHCSHCGNRVPAWAAWTEIAIVVIGGLVGFRVGHWSWLPAFLVLGFTLVCVVAIDARLHLIPTKLVYPAAGASLVLLAGAALIDGRREQFLWALIGGLGASLVLWVLVIISPAGMGQGDARLCLLLGIFLGWHGWQYVIWGLFLGFVLGALGGLLLMARRKGGRKTQIAFGPYLASAGLLIALWPTLLDGVLVR